MTRRRRLLAAAAGVAALAWLAIHIGNDVAIALESPAPSRSTGTASDGALENGKRLPTAGPNFRAYSRLGAALGRNSVHHRVRDAVLDAYAAVAIERPNARFVYGETGWPSGGRFRPHRTHRNGLSVDFMVPVVDADGRPAELPTAPWLRFGYDAEFDSAGRYGEMRIDFAAVAAHLAALDDAARANGLRVRRVIFAPELVRRMEETAEGRTVSARTPWMEGTPWVRHDEHYHVDFALADDEAAAAPVLERRLATRGR
jgi:penicillin-insensitive murein endopeptidase